jgi:oxygen-independent coproporphyrinogen-3 oxidase
MLHETRGRLAGAGYRAYEISNYARAGAECRHNLMYWEGGNYIGLGPSAASHVQGWRWKNRAHLGEWELAVMAGGVPATEAERLTPWQRAGELVMLQLRLARGVRFADVENRTGVDPRERYRLALRHLSGIGLIDANETGFALTERGIDVADAVAAEFVDVG